MGQRIVQVDAFTSTPFRGNPAAVCILDAAASEEWMQAVAREMNLSETAFLYRDGEAFALRWFTPAVEVDLCGHATLASAHVLWENGHLPPDAPAVFETNSGRLTARLVGDWIELDFPATPAAEVGAVPGLEVALGVDARWVGRSEFDFLVEIDSEATVRNLQPDMTALRQLHCRGVMVTSRADAEEFDFVSRFFAPAVGVDEDPVTGSAHCALGPYWAQHLERSELTAMQVSARGGVLRVRLEGDRVILGGQAVTVFRGELADGA
ncbi:MAG: PhzF family phenazine biosynthesis protein [Dehalococcoidia bacterium]